MITLRPYQTNAIRVANEAKGSALIVAPTGSGKTHIIAGIVQSNPTAHILILSHVKEILQQNASKLYNYVDSSLVGVYSRGLNEKSIKQYTIASIQTVYKLGELFTHFDIIIIDEVHTVPAKGTGRYRTFLGSFESKKVVGLTATPFRLDHGLLTENHLFDKIDYNIDILELIEQGYLCKITSKATEEEYDVSNLKKIAGDFSQKDMSQKLDKTEITYRICKELAKYKQSRKKWLVFAIDIKHAENINEMLNSLGVVSVAVHSKLGFDRQYLLDLYSEDHIQAIVCVESLTTGFDSPKIDLIALLRPTESAGLLVQMVGRGLRTHKSKENCLVLDFAGNIKRLGPINDLVQNAIAKKEPGKKKDFPSKRCPECSEIVAIQTKKCPDCGYVFPEAPVKLTEVADESPIIKTKSEKLPQSHSKIFPFKVNKVEYSLHWKVGKPTSLKVTYVCGIRKFFEWIAIEAEGYPNIKARDWWRLRDQFSTTYFPSTTKEALNVIHTLKTPKVIHVLALAKYPEIVRYEW